MILLKKATEVTELVTTGRLHGKSIGFVPTMGALHEGHLSLIARAKAETNLVICSIFVNPAQFNDASDLKWYPRPIENDIAMLTNAGCDALFIPEVEDIYPDGLDQLTVFELGHLETFLEGASRPGHFQGVANVVNRLLSITTPDFMYLGQKDFQQVKVLERLLTITGSPTRIVICPILREKSGLAMSSRNIRLTPEQLSFASVIYASLQFAQTNYRQFTPEQLKTICIDKMESAGAARVDYLEFCDTDSFFPVEDWPDAEHIVAVTAVLVGKVRLLDNMMLK